ncbi:WD repeat-containing protein, putative [Plasmodium malariae]|uniref:WD repeat-containing protein, putative n=1 Tax=Plasmodium malariae TaxID=5858 RepID=A0A1D3JJK5_PLAMA|nr:WD repeat-containing protein, putative [Plasmodium malariae]SBT86655.1 WD repeat-containing protein, putative [Plasmodium malariae]
MVDIKKENISVDKKKIKNKIDNDEYNATSLVEKITDNEETNIDNTEDGKTDENNRKYEEDSNLESDSDDSESFEKLLKNAKVVNISSFNKDELISGEKNSKTFPIDEKYVSMALSFIYNFMVEHEFVESLEVFEKEYVKKFGDDINKLRKTRHEDIFTQNELLRNDFLNHEKFTKEIQNSLEDANKKVQKTIKERDYYLMHHKRVLQEKETLNKEIQKQKKEIEKFQNSVEEIRTKYESVLKEKMLAVLEKEKRDTKIEGLNKYIERLKDLLESSKSDSSIANISSIHEKSSNNVPQNITSKRDKKDLGKIDTKREDTPWPNKESAPCEMNENEDKENFNLCIFSLNIEKSFNAHNNAVSGLAYNNKVHLLATGGDDGQWKTWSATNYELVMASQAHKKWIGDICFNKEGNILCTCSGDSKIKLWDMIKEKCVHTFKNSTGPIWSLSFHYEGDFFASASMDQTIRIFDMNSLRQRQILRGHVDSVNCVNFHPFFSTLVSASVDKTVSIWDMRSGLCENTFYGHHFPCSYSNFSTDAKWIYSCDSGGVVKIWDIRTNKCLINLDAGPSSANKCPMDNNNKYLFIASEDHTIKIFDITERKFVRALKHEFPIKNVILENNKLYCSLSNGNICVWEQMEK